MIFLYHHVSKFNFIKKSSIELNYHLLDDSEPKPSQIPIPTTLYTPTASTMSRTSSRESILSEHSLLSNSSLQQQRRPSKLPLPTSRSKKTTNEATPVKNS